MDTTESQNKPESIMSHEEALRESELRFRAVVDAATDAVILTDETGLILTMNKASEQIFGYGKELLGQRVSILLPPRHRQSQIFSFGRNAAGTGKYQISGKTLEMRGLKKDQTEFPMEFTLATWKIGDRSYYCSRFRDITRQKLAEEALLRGTAQVQLMQDVAVAANGARDIKQALQYAVDRICEFTGWPIGHVYFPDSTGEVLVSSDIWYLGDQFSYATIRNTIRQTSFSPGVGMAGLVLQRRNVVWSSDLDATGSVLINSKQEAGLRTGFAFPVLVDSTIVAVLEFLTKVAVKPDEPLMNIMRHIAAMLSPVFERQQALSAVRTAEERWRQLVESVQAIVWRADAQSRVTFVSKKAVSILGFPEEEWLSPTDFWKLHIHPEDLETTLPFIAPARIELTDQPFDFRMIARDGRIVWLRSLVRVLEHDDLPRELVGVMIDITNQKKSELELKQSRSQLRALSAHLQHVREDERTKIAREVHDELGQVLTALKMDLSLLNRGLLESSITMPRVKLMEEIGSMRKLVDRTIQTVRRISTELRPEVLDYLDLRAAMEWQIQEFQARHQVTCEFLSNVEGLELDRERATALYRILQEALTNVARHSDASRVNIGIHQDQGRLTLEIADNGRGITEAELAKAQSFGLIGIRERALLLGGDLDIKGTPGQGTTLTVRVAIESGESGQERK